jgi:hypothetical protein
MNVEKLIDTIGAALISVMIVASIVLLVSIGIKSFFIIVTNIGICEMLCISIIVLSIVLILILALIRDKWTIRS